MPDELLVRLIAWPVASFVILTMAPLIIVPDGSPTVPTMEPVPMVVCASSWAVSAESHKAAETAGTIVHPEV